MKLNTMYTILGVNVVVKMSDTDALTNVLRMELFVCKMFVVFLTPKYIIAQRLYSVISTNHFQCQPQMKNVF